MEVVSLSSLFIASFLAATILPLSSEVALTAVLVAGVNPVSAIVVASVGNILGSITTYSIGRAGKTEWITKYLRVSEDKLNSVHIRWIKIAPITSLLCFLPVIGDLFAITLGLAKYDARKFILFMSIGKFARYTIYYYLFSKVV